MLRTGGVRGDERQVDVTAHAAGQLDLRFLGSLAQALHRHAVAGQIHAGLRLEARDHPVDNLLIEVVAAETVVTGSRQHLLHAVAHLDDRHIEGAAAQVIHHDLLIGLFVDTVGERCRRRLVDDTLDIQSRNLAGVLGRLALRVAEICRDGDDRLGHLIAEICLRVLLQLRQDHSGDLLRGVVLAVNGHLVRRAHLSLDGGNGALGVRDRLLLCNAADDAFAVLLECHNRRRGARAFGVGDDDSLAALNNGNAGIGCTKVNTDDLCHNNYLPYISHMCVSWLP